MRYPFTNEAGLRRILGSAGFTFSQPCSCSEEKRWFTGWLRRWEEAAGLPQRVAPSPAEAVPCQVNTAVRGCLLNFSLEL